jgi:hypothetical protein
MSAADQPAIAYIRTEKELKKAPTKYPWPRKAVDNDKVDLGIDVLKKRQDIIKLVHKFFSVEGIPMEELLQEVYAAILHKNYTKSAHDPRKSSFGHYVYMVANNVCINLVHKKRRYDKEKDSIYEPMNDEERPLVETAEMEPSSNFVESESVLELEEICRQKKMYDCAKFIRAARTGANVEVIRLALSYGGKTITNKHIREIRHKINGVVSNSSDFAFST